MKNYQPLVDYRKLEKINEKTARSDCRKELSIYRSSFNLCSEIIGSIMDLSFRKDYSASQIASFLILFRLMGSMRSMEVLSLKGYYYEVSLLKRSFFESLGLSKYLSENEEDAQKWLKDIRINAASKTLLNSLSGIVKLIPEDKDFWQEIYGKLCDYVHSNVPAVISVLDLESYQIVGVESGEASGKAKLLMPFKYDKIEVTSVCLLPFMFVITLNELFKDEIPKDMQRKMEKHIATVIKIQNQNKFTFKL